MFADSSKGSPRISHVEEPPEAKTSDPKTKNDPKNEEDLNYMTLKMVLETQQKTLGMVLGSATKDRSSGMTEEDKLDQKDQMIKVTDLDKLEDLKEGISSIVRGDWIHRIKPVISNLSKRAT